MTEIEWANLNAAALRELAARDAIVIVPVGSTEQHGPHLPVQVDALLAGEVARRAASRTVEKGVPAVVTPVIWTGLAEHHMSFGGTITLDFETFTAILRCVCQSVLRHGFRRVLMLNGHGGNIMALNVIVGELTRELSAPVATATYWQVAETEFRAILEAQDNIRHAGEAETSMLLALKPELVDQDAIAGIEAPADGLRPEGGLFRWRPIADWSDSGVIGAPAAASAEKGVRLLDAAAEALAEKLARGLPWGNLGAA